MSTTSSIAPASRSASPLTPEASDCPEPVSVQAELDKTSSWYSPMHPPKSTPPQWVSDLHLLATHHKVEEENMLHLDELIEQDAYEDSPHAEIYGNPFLLPSQISYSAIASLPSGQVETLKLELGARGLVPDPLHGLPAHMKPIPPPAALPRKPDVSSGNQRVVSPPKETCFNLPIVFPSIPEGGAKSRVETQVRITMDLAHSCSSSDPFKYDRVGSWKWLKLPRGTATKRRTRKQGKIDPDPQDVLHLTVSVACSTPPHNPVLSCSSCQAREAKRVAKKLAARVRPARSDSDSGGNGTGKSKRTQEDTTSIIQFNCAELLDFSTGSVVLPLRITCYCRHHREKVGFNVHFNMMDHSGKIVGTGMTKPIMITDDHKTSSANKPPEVTNSFLQSELPDCSRVGGIVKEANSDGRALSRRKTDAEGNTKSPKKRHRPYDASAKPNRINREDSISSAPSPSTIHSPVPITRASTPASSLLNLVTSDPPPASQPPPLHYPVHGFETSSPDTLATPLDHNSDVSMPPMGFDIADILPEPPVLQPGALLHPSVVPSDLSLANLPPPLPFLFLDPNSAAQPVHVQIPIIHRLIPNSGPTFGGIEVTLLGANFHPTMQLTCVFGDVSASSTHIWSGNTLVCILPAQATPGAVPVWFDGFTRSDDSPLFTYVDETDRTLMELALQVVGLKMTGKLEDAKNVALRIVGNSASDNSESNNNTPGMMHVSSPSIRDFRPLLLGRGGEIDNFESRIVDFLSILDTPCSTPHSLSTSAAISCPSSSGQTLLHLSAFLGLVSLTQFLIEHGADLDVRDCNGFTPLHFAALAQSHDCATALINAGADLEIVDSRGRISEELSASGIIGNILAKRVEVQSEGSREDEDGDLGDAEDSDSNLHRIFQRRSSTKTSRHNHSGKGTPHRSENVSRAATPPPDIPSDEKEKRGADLGKQPVSDVNDAKRAASFMEKMRTLAQIPSRPGIIPNIVQLPLPHLSAVPWATLPQIPMVLPIFVPMNWAALRGGVNSPTTDRRNDGEGDEATRNLGNIASRTANEWRATWEKWVALAIATTPRQQAEDVPPPVYTPRAEEEIQATQSTADVPVQASSSRSVHADTRPVGYHGTPIPDQVVELAYQRNTKQNRRSRKKHDCMLLLFWLPILLLSLVWAFHHGMRVVLQVVRMVVPAKGQNVRS